MSAEKKSHRFIMEKCCLRDNVFILDRIFVKLADNEDRYKILEEFTFWPDQTIWFRVTCMAYALEHRNLFSYTHNGDVVDMITTLFLIGSS